MFIQTEDTPNPNSLKFILESILTSGNSLDYTSLTANAELSDFAKDVFIIGGVERIFILDNFITITKTSEIDWDVLKPQILNTIMNYLVAKKEIGCAPKPKERPVLNNEIENEIYDLIEERVKPAVAMDGGDVEFVRFDDSNGTVYVSMHGSCSGCPSSSATLKDGILRMLQYYVPEIKDVVAV